LIAPRLIASRETRRHRPLGSDGVEIGKMVDSAKRAAARYRSRNVAARMCPCVPMTAEVSARKVARPNIRRNNFSSIFKTECGAGQTADRRVNKP